MEENNNMLVRNTDTESDIIFVEDWVTEIGDFAFRGCAAKEIILPDSVESIRQCAFAGCKKLEKIVFGKGLEYCDDDIILGSPVQEIVWTKPIESEEDSAFRSLLYSLIREEDTVYYLHPEKKYDVLKRFLRTGRPQRTFLLTCNGRSVRLPRYICSYLHRLMISDTAYNCLTKNGNAYYEYRNLHSCLSDFQNRVSVATEWYVMDNLECAKDYLIIHATLITKRMTEEADDETLAMYLNLGLLSNKDLQRTLQWASEKNMPASVAYILDQMRKRGLKAKTELAL